MTKSEIICWMMGVQDGIEVAHADEDDLINHAIFHLAEIHDISVSDIEAVSERAHGVRQTLRLLRDGLARS